jgi:hypothetical protein
LSRRRDNSVRAAEQLDIEEAIAAAPAPDSEIPDLPRRLRRA